VRQALNAQARKGEGVKLKRKDEVDPQRGEVLIVHLTCFRHDARPAMPGPLTLRQEISERQCRHVRGGYPAVARLLWGKLRSSPIHPDHFNSPQVILTGVALATGMDPADVDQELKDVLAEEREELKAKMRGGLRDTGKGFTVRSSPAAAQPDAAPQDAGPGEPTKGEL
jgi:hypothetical protein